MRRTLLALAIGLVLPLGVAHADIAADLKAGLPMQQVLTNAQASNMSLEAALKQIFTTSPEQSYAAITAAIQLNGDQAANIVSASLSRQYNLNPPQVVAAALQGAPDRAGASVPTAIVKAPSYYTVPIVQRALAEGVDGSKFIPQAMRTAPRMADTILTQALKSAPQQTRAIMEVVIADQPDKATHYVSVALDAKAPSSDVLAAAFKAAPAQADAIAAIATNKGIPASTIAAAAEAAKIQVAGMGPASGSMGSPTKGSSSSTPTSSPPSSGGGGGGGSTKPASPK